MLLEELEIATTLDFSQVNELFGGNIQCGIRTPRDRDFVTVINKHTDKFYEDKWVDGVLHYTGEGRTGDQRLIRGNKRLVEAAEQGKPIYLLEVFQDGKYIFQGEVELCADFYTERQLDSNKEERDVLMFPLKPKLIHLPEDDTILTPEKIRRQKQLYDLSLEDLFYRANLASQSSINRPTQFRKTSAPVRREYTRDDAIAALVKKLADGKCSLCGNDAPFIGRNGQPFLEAHHIVWLSRGGFDVIDNSSAICPNCHRKMHDLDKDEDVSILMHGVEQRRAQYSEYFVMRF